MKKFTTGHCENHKKPGGCDLHNLHCGYPDCDRKEVKVIDVEHVALDDGQLGWVIKES